MVREAGVEPTTFGSGVFAGSPFSLGNRSNFRPVATRLTFPPAAAPLAAAKSFYAEEWNATENSLHLITDGEKDSQTPHRYVARNRAALQGWAGLTLFLPISDFKPHAIDWAGVFATQFSAHNEARYFQLPFLPA